jgi:hypothetical protein
MRTVSKIETAAKQLEVKTLLGAPMLFLLLSFRFPWFHHIAAARAAAAILIPIPILL